MRLAAEWRVVQVPQMRCGWGVGEAQGGRGADQVSQCELGVDDRGIAHRVGGAFDHVDDVLRAGAGRAQRRGASAMDEQESGGRRCLPPCPPLFPATVLLCSPGTGRYCGERPNLVIVAAHDVENAVAAAHVVEELVSEPRSLRRPCNEPRNV